jgi:acyl-CoA dehydrogenase
MMMQEVGRSSGAFAASSTIRINIFGFDSIVNAGTDRQRAEWLPSIINRQSRACFGVTEPDTGLDTSKISTKAETGGHVYVVSGQKLWTSTTQQADKIVLLARTMPLDQCVRPMDGLTLFYADLDHFAVKIHEIEKMGRHAVNSNQLFIDNLIVPVERRIGDEGIGFHCIIDSLNPESTLNAAEVVGLERRTLEKAVSCAGERVVFGRQNWAKPAIRSLGECSQIPCGGRRIQSLRLPDPHTRRDGLRHPISRRKIFSRNGRNPAGPDLTRDDLVFYRRARARIAEILLNPTRDFS